MRALEGALRDHYREVAGNGPVETVPRALVEALAAELSRSARPRVGEVVTGQIRRIGVGTWALHVALMLLIAVLFWFGVPLVPVAGALGAALALASLAELTRSRSCGMAELEAACIVNTPAVACARGLVLGCADACVLLVFVLVAGAGSDIWPVVSQACAPYLLAIGGGFLVARRVASADATVAAVTAAAGVCAACVVLRALCPAAFAPATALVWWLAAAAALAFAAVEARAWLRAAACGFADVAATAPAL